jgi:hypothetical protein
VVRVHRVAQTFVRVSVGRFITFRRTDSERKKVGAKGIEGYGKVDRGRGRGGYRIDESIQRDEIVSPGSIRGIQAGDNG